MPSPEYEVYDLTYDCLNDADDQRVFQVVVICRRRPGPLSLVRHVPIVHADSMLPKHPGGVSGNEKVIPAESGRLGLA